MNRSFLMQVCASTLIAGGMALPALAVDNVWTNANGNGSVNYADNWSLGHVPNMSERAIIPAGPQLTIHNGQQIVADQIVAAADIGLAGGWLRCHSFITNANTTLVSYNHANIQADNVQIGGTWNLFGTNINRLDNGIDPTVHIAQTAQVIVWEDDAYLGVRVENAGLIDGQNHTLSTGASGFPVFINNNSGGVIRNASFVARHFPGYLDSYVINEGTMEYSGGSPQLSVYFANAGLLRLDAAQLAVENLVITNGQLDSGAWILKNGSALNHDKGDLTRIGNNAMVRLENGQNSFEGLSRITNMVGRLELKNTTLQLAPPFFGTMRLGQYGFLRMEEGARVEVLGSITMDAESVLDKIVNQPNANDVIATYASSAVNGQLIVELQDSNLVPAGTRIPLVQDIADCCNIGGSFASVLVFGTPESSSIDSQPHVVRLLIGNGDNCPADLDADGQVGLSDLALLLGHFGMASGATHGDGDLDADGDVDLQDLAALLSSFGAICP